MSGPPVGVTELIHTALIAVHAFARPENWNDPEDPEQAEAWTLVDAAMLAYKQWHDGERIAAALNQQGGAADDEATVERAARAIYAESWPLPDDPPFDAACASERDSAYKLARAALAAVKGVES